MARLPYVDPASAPEAIRAALDRAGAPLHIFRMLAHAEGNLRPALRFGASVLSAQQLDGRLRELAILRTARLCEADYEWTQHVPMARAEGATEAAIEAVAAGALDDDALDDDARLVCAAATELVCGVTLGEAIFERLVERLGPPEIVELILAVGYYRMLATLMRATEVDPDPPAGAAVLAAAQGRQP